MGQIIAKSSTTKDNHIVPYDVYTRGYDKAIIVAHGFHTSKAALLFKDLARHLNDEHDVLVLDFRGHGQSKGRFYWTSKEYLDLLAIVEAEKNNYRKIGLMGFSLGSASSLIAASKSEHIDSVIAVSTPSEFEKIEYHIWQLNFNLDIQYNLLSEGRIGKGVKPGPFWLPKEKPKDVVTLIKQPVYYIHGTKDWIIKPWHSEFLYQKSVSKIKKLEIMKGAPHAEYILKTHENIFVKNLKDWFKETL